MHKKMPFYPTVFLLALPVIASAAGEANVETTNFSWSASTGMGYDSNVYLAPSAPYLDLSTGLNINPADKSGFFVPFDLKIEAERNRSPNIRLLGSARLDGSFYGSGLSNANEYSMQLKAGSEYALAGNGRSQDTVYVGILAGNRKKVYVDHDDGTDKIATVSGNNLSTLYNYTRVGAEAEYKNRASKIDYGFNGQYFLNDYEAVVGASQLDHAYYTLGASTSIPVASQSRLDLSFDHSAQDYSSRHARNAQGVLLNTNPLLLYTYNSVGASLRNRFSSDWLLHLDFDHTRRSDNYVGYNDHQQNRYGARLIFGQGSIKMRLALHHWTRDYPNAFAFDVAAGGEKTYSGNDLKIKVELEQTKNSSFWGELVYDSQNTTDLRYDYIRKQIMAGMSWVY